MPEFVKISPNVALLSSFVSGILQNHLISEAAGLKKKNWTNTTGTTLGARRLSCAVSGFCRFAGEREAP